MTKPSPAIVLLWAVLFLGGVDRIVFGQDVPFGMLQVSVTVGGIVLYLLKGLRSSSEAGHRIADWTIRIALLVIVVDVGVSEVRRGRAIWGTAILAVAFLMFGIFAADRSGRKSTGLPADRESP